MDQWTEQDFNALLIEAVRRAGLDREFRINLLNSSQTVLQELAGNPLPDNYEVSFVEDSDCRRTIVLPPFESSETLLCREDLERVAGGVCVLTFDP